MTDIQGVNKLATITKACFHVIQLQIEIARTAVDRCAGLAPPRTGSPAHELHNALLIPSASFILVLEVDSIAPKLNKYK